MTDLRGTSVNVLDHGFVQLVDYMGDDLAVSRAARNSYNAAWRAGKNEKSDWKLLHYLMRNRHTTPFEAVEFQFAVKAPIFVFRQWHRHRTWSYNELSARYRELPEEFYVPKAEQIGVACSDNKQTRVFPTFAGDMLVPSMIDHSCRCAFEVYRSLLERNVPREIARSVLPLNTYSHMFAKVDLHNLLHFLTVRLHAHAQYEIRVYAQAIVELIQPIVPVCIEAWTKSRRQWEKALKLIEEENDAANV